MDNRAPQMLDLIGNTPMVEITRFDTGKCRLFVKLESNNPGGSIKDRIARRMIEAAEMSGRLKPGGTASETTIVEATAGNTGLGLALIGGLKGYRVILVVPDKMSREKVAHCKALGAEVRMARSDVNKGHPEYYQEVAQRIADETGGYYINQFSNMENVATHETTTGPEIWEQMEQSVDAVVCGIGSGGTMTGLGRFFGRVSPQTEMVLADPVGSILAPLVNTGEKVEPGSWLVEGIGEDFIPDITDMSLVKKAYAITDRESVETARELLAREGILAGSSTGTLFAAALKYCIEQKEPKRVVTFICDRGDKYLSKTYSDFWMAEQGLNDIASSDTVEGLLTRRHDRGDLVVVRPGETAAIAYRRMRMADVSQLPVVDDDGKLIGMMDETAVLAVTASGGNLSAKVADIMRPPAQQRILPHTATPKEAAEILKTHTYIIVMQDEKFLGLVTRIDLLNHYYLKGLV